MSSSVISVSRSSERVDGAVVLLLRRPALFALFIGCGVAAAASGTFTLRLVLDGALSFAFVPVFHVLALRAVFRVRRQPGLTFARAVDLFFAGTRVWLLSFVAITAIAAIVPPRRIGPWLLPVLGAAVIPLLWSLGTDFRFFRDVMRRAPRAAFRDLIVQRAIAWLLIAAYFAGPWIANDPVPAIGQWLRGL